MAACPFFGRCGGCKFDFADENYRTAKAAGLPRIENMSAPVWIKGGTRRRADFAFAGGRFGFYEHHSKTIVPITNCPNLLPEINALIGPLGRLPYSGSGSVLVTKCDNGIDVAVTSDIGYFSPEFRDAAARLDVARVTWNGRSVVTHTTPFIDISGHRVEFPAGAFLQPSAQGEAALRHFVTSRASGAGRVADLFCGLGNFTFALNADGFDIAGPHHKRDLFKNPVTRKMLASYDCVVIDPPRAGAMAQCTEIAASPVPRVIYISCNPTTFMRDKQILERGGYQVTELVPVDQFPGTAHWEIAAVFTRIGGRYMCAAAATNH